MLATRARVIEYYAYVLPIFFEFFLLLTFYLKTMFFGEKNPENKIEESKFQKFFLCTSTFLYKYWLAPLAVMVYSPWIPIDDKPIWVGGSCSPFYDFKECYEVVTPLQFSTPSVYQRKTKSRGAIPSCKADTLATFKIREILTMGPGHYFNISLH